MEFPRLDLPQLIEEGRKALHDEDYLRAVPIFREAVHRAPFRQEFKDWLAMAIEGSLIQNAAGPSPAQSTLTVMRSHAPVKPASSPVVEPPEFSLPVDLHRPQHEVDRSPEVTPPVFRSTSVARNRKAFGGSSHTALKSSHASSKPSHFEKRHRRGPFSALLLGAVVGLVLIGSVVAGVYLYMGSLVDVGQKPTISRAQVNSIVEQSYTYRQKGEYALAIARLESLPESPERSQLLAETYMEQGNLNFDKVPPQIESAIEAYNNAVRYEPNEAEYGYSLGMAYLSLSREKTSEAETAEHYLDLARQTFLAVLERNPDHIGSLDGVSRVAVLQRDNVAAANAWRQIIQVAPDSYEAERARNNLKSLNYKP